MPRPALRHATFALAALVATSSPAAPQHDDPDDLTSLSLEQLVNVPVYSASKFVQRASDAPSAVTVITAQDIRTFGYRTLADALRSVRGLYVHYDRYYSYLGLRGFARPGDYNSRFLLLLDGNRLNEAVYDQASIGREFVLDPDLIDRIEFVPGPGSSIYGNNAFFGVINVISRQGAAIDGVEASAEIGSGRTQKERISYGRRYESGLDVVLSGTHFDSRGANRYYQAHDAPPDSDGIARGTDYERAPSLYGKVSYGGLTMAAGRTARTKGLPTGIYSTVFNDRANHSLDEQSFVDTQYQRAFGRDTELLGRAFFGDYHYYGNYITQDTAGTGTLINREQANSRWWGTEAKVVTSAWTSHKTVLGAELQDNIRQQLRTYDVDPYAAYVDERRNSRRYAVYVQDEYSISPRVTLYAGARYDHSSNVGSNTSPRAALLIRPSEVDVVKLIYGTAFRAPNTSELYSTSPALNQKGNPALRPERIRTYELVYERYTASNLRLSAGAFYYRIDDLINQVTDPADSMLVYRNVDSVETQGIELEADKTWASGVRTRASFAYQAAHDKATGAWLTNSPRNLVKLNVSLPLAANRARAGLELQYTSPRRTDSAGIGGFTVANLTLSSTALAKNLDVSLGLYNLAGKRYADPAASLDSPAQDRVAQDGRTVRLKLTYRF